MKPINFEQANKVLNGNKKTYSAQVEGVEPLPIFTNQEQCVSLWKMSWKERLSALFFGRVWLAVLSGSTQPPVVLFATKKYFGRERI